MCTEIDELKSKNQSDEKTVSDCKRNWLNSNDALCYSRKLDELITIYQKLKNDNIQKVEVK